MSAAPEVCARASMLDKVFNKALDVSVNAMGEEVLVEAFGDMKPQYGAQMEKLFRNMIGRTQSNMEASFRDVCIRHDVDEGLRKLEKAPPQSSDLDLSTEDPLAATIAELRSIEAQELRAAIKSLEAESKKLTDQASRIRNQMTTEVQATTEELTKLKSAASQCS